MPGLLRGMARTAAVVGTATATRNAVNRRMAEKNVAAYAGAVDKAHAQPAPTPQYAPPPPQPPPLYAPLPPGPELYAPAPIEQVMPYIAFGQAPSAAAMEEDAIRKLERLGRLRAQGLLSDEEFAAARARLLAP
jgi:hypothetical protein